MTADEDAGPLTDEPARTAASASGSASGLSFDLSRDAQVDPMTGLIHDTRGATDALMHELEVTQLRDRVTIPQTWLLCSCEHRIEVVKRDATPAD